MNGESINPINREERNPFLLAMHEILSESDQRLSTDFFEVMRRRGAIGLLFKPYSLHAAN